MGMEMVYSFPSSPLYAAFSGGNHRGYQPHRGPRRGLVLSVATAGPQFSSSAPAEERCLGVFLG